MSEYVEFEVRSAERFEKLQRVFLELKHNKNSNDWRSTEELLQLFDDETLKHFYWPPSDERRQRLHDLRTRPIIITPTEETAGQRWDFDSLIHAFESGEYELRACEMVDSKKARLTFEAFAYPYGGVGCMVALIEVFGFTVTGIDDGTGLVNFPPDLP